MRIGSFIVFAALAAALVIGMALIGADTCCAEEDEGGCDEVCACVCCGHNSVTIDAPAPSDAVIESIPVPHAATSMLVSFDLTPEFPPPRS